MFFYLFLSIFYICQRAAICVSLLSSENNDNKESIPSINDDDKNSFLFTVVASRKTKNKCSFQASSNQNLLEAPRQPSGRKPAHVTGFMNSFRVNKDK